MSLIKKNSHFKEYNEADKIIRYLINPLDQDIQLTESEKKKYSLLEEVHGYRLRYKTKKHIVNLLFKKFEVSKRQAYNYINEAEYVFGSVGGVDKDYERQFLLECSRKNISIAMKSGNSGEISKAILAHAKLAGLEEEILDLPDFGKLEQHNYNIMLPDNMIDLLKQLVNTGAVNLNTVRIPETIEIKPAEE